MKTAKLWTKDYLFLLLSVFFAAFTHNAFTVVFPVYVLDIGGSNSLTGLMLTGLTLAGIVTRLIFGPLIDRIGRKKILVLGSVAFALNTLAYCFVSDLSTLFVLRIINGISQGIFFPVPPTLVGDITPRERLVDGLGYFGIASALAASLAPSVCLTLYENLGAVSLFVCTTLFACVSVVFTLMITDRYSHPKESTADALPEKRKLPGISAVLEISVLLPSCLAFLINFGNSSVTNFLAPCGLSRGITSISTFFLVNNLVMVVTRLITGKLERRFGKGRLIAAGFIFTAASIILLAFAQDILLVLAAAVLFGAGVSLATQLLQVLVMQRVPANRRGVANSTFMLFGDIGIGAGAAAWGSVSQYGGYTLTYLLSAASVGVATLVHGLRLAPKIKKEKLEKAKKTA